MDVIDAADRAPLIDEAAQIWAEATAARDQRAQVPALEDSRPVIQGVLDRSSRAFLLIARCADGTAAGFAAIEPAPDSNEAAQISYIGVRPRLWGQRIGETLLLETCQRLKAAGTPALSCPSTWTTTGQRPYTSAWAGKPSARRPHTPGQASRNNAMNCA